MTQIDKSKPVMITGATGYVAGWIVKNLLDEGHIVHASVRNPDNIDKLQHLIELARNSNGSIKFFKADLLTEGSYDEAMHGCELVIHTASPFIIKVNDALKDLVDPAVKGTRNVLESVNKCESVKRVVLTSSCAAIYGDTKDLLSYKDQTMTEENWNTTSSLDHQPYSYSKVMAEKEAWKMANEQKRWDLIVINPSLVLGPSLNLEPTSESFNIVKQIGNGTMKMGAPSFEIGAVDVRDLAIAHYNAAYLPNSKGRYILSAENTSIIGLANMLKSKYGELYSLPNRILPKLLVWLLAPLSGLTRKNVSQNIGYSWKADNTKSKKELGINYRPLSETINDFFQQMVDGNVFRK